MKKRLKISALMLAPALIMAPGAGWAVAFAETAAVEEIITTTSRSPQALAQQSQSLTVVKKDDISFIGATHINEIATRVPGMTIARNDGQEYLAAIRSPILTGAGACGAFLMAQDGIALRAAGFCNVNELFEAFTEQAERIEVLKGPGSSLYGSNAMHGIVNVITPAADDDQGRVSLEGGANGFVRFNGSKGFLSGPHGFRISGTVTHEDGYRADSGYDQQKISLRHDYDGAVWDIASNLSLTNLDQETAGYITGLDAYKDRDIARQNPNPEAFRKARSLRYWSQFSTAVADDMRLQITPYVRLLDMEFLMHFLPGKPLEKNSQVSFGLQNAVYFWEETAFELIAGADFEYTRGSLEQTQENPTTGSAFLMATIPAGKQYDYDVSSTMVAAFLQGDWTVMPRLHLMMGARLEYIHYNYDNNMLAGRTDEDGIPCGFGGCRYSRPESRGDNFTIFSPKIGLLYEMTDNHAAYLNVSHGFRAPQTAELYRLQRAQTVADLDKVSLKNIEFGFRGHEDRVRYSLSFYAMKKDNYIFRDSDFFNVNNGKSDHIGADIMLDLVLHERVSLRSTVSLARHRYRFDYISNGINLNNKDIDSAPRKFGSMELNWQLTDKAKIALEWVHMGAYYLDPENLHRYGGHDYLNLRTAVQVSPQYGLFLRAMNLSNKAYAERADYTSFTEERYFPGKPRSFYAGFNYIF